MILSFLVLVPSFLFSNFANNDFYKIGTSLWKLFVIVLFIILSIAKILSSSTMYLVAFLFIPISLMFIHDIELEQLFLRFIDTYE